MKNIQVVSFGPLVYKDDLVCSYGAKSSLVRRFYDHNDVGFCLMVG